MFQLSNLTSAGKKRKRIGRGGSRGGTSGKGHKGQKARTGHHGVGVGFEGGQMPLSRRLPKHGFNNKPFAQEWIIVNVDVLNTVFSDGDEVTKEKLQELGVITPKKGSKGKRFNSIKILGNGSLSKKLTVFADAASQSAIELIQAAGGKINLTKEK
ncbi:MAG: 50S ribosomal protein L15 [Candidatus Babeliales bacterium]